MQPYTKQLKEAIYQQGLKDEKIRKEKSKNKLSNKNCYTNIGI